MLPCPLCRARTQPSMFAATGICYVCAMRIDWLHLHPEERRYAIRPEHWARLHAYLGM